jgi:hypothetical protein
MNRSPDFELIADRIQDRQFKVAAIDGNDLTVGALGDDQFPPRRAATGNLRSAFSPTKDSGTISCRVPRSTCNAFIIRIKVSSSLLLCGLTISMQFSNWARTILVGLDEERQVIASGVGHVLIADGYQVIDLGDQAATDGFHPLMIRPVDLVGQQHLFQLPDQTICSLQVFLLVFAQFGARLIVQVLEHADEQVGRIVERLGKLRADVDDRQRVALLRLQFRHFAGIQRAGDIAVLLELRNGDVWRWGSWSTSNCKRRMC